MRAGILFSSFPVSRVIPIPTERLDGWMDGWMDGWTDGQVSEGTYREIFVYSLACLRVPSSWVLYAMKPLYLARKGERYMVECQIQAF